MSFYMRKIGFIIFLFFTTWISNASAAPAFTLQSSAFSNAGIIPVKYTCDGQDVSPPLNWQGAPANTKSFTLIVDDPDAPMGTWTHWIIVNIPESTHSLIENFNTLPDGAQFIKNSFDKLNYGGPCFSSGTHHYYFKLYALDTFLKATENSTKAQIESEMQGHVLANTTLVGIYKK